MYTACTTRVCKPERSSASRNAKICTKSLARDAAAKQHTALCAGLIVAVMTPATTAVHRLSLESCPGSQIAFTAWDLYSANKRRLRLKLRCVPTLPAGHCMPRRVCSVLQQVATRIAQRILPPFVSILVVKWPCLPVGSKFVVIDRVWSIVPVVCQDLLHA